MPEYPTERPSASGTQSPRSNESIKRKQQSQQTRQLLSCTKCRERKVKCDRTKPCSACCVRGAPKECHFVAEGGDYAPIQQSYELKRLRLENIRLKEHCRAYDVPFDDEESDPAGSPDSQHGDRPTSSQKRRAARQKRFQGPEWQDSIYFGSPGLASVANDFATVNLTPSSSSLAHSMPRGSDMYTPKTPPTHPFATIFKATPEECIPELLSCLPPKAELLENLETFKQRVNIFSFPHVPIEITESEVERFLSDVQKNAEICPDMLALLFAAIALGTQHFVWDRSTETWKSEVANGKLPKGEVYIAASMQALRLASFMHRPSLLGIQALIMIGPYLTNSGRFLDAWTLFGTTIRLAHSIGLHRHPKYLDPTPPTQREFSIRQTLWWWMLHMDEQYSMTLGRPLGISGIGDCPPPHELSPDPQILRFHEFVNHFTVLARQILSSDRLTNNKIDEFTDSLRGLLDTMPEMLQFDESWIDASKEIQEWPLSAMAAVYYCKTHTYLILLNRQRVDKSLYANMKMPTPNFRPVNPLLPSQLSPPATPKNLLRGRDLVLASSRNILNGFLFFYHRERAALIDWTMGQQAFNSCMILLLDALEKGAVTENMHKVELALIVFEELNKHGVHKLASIAVEKITWGLRELVEITENNKKTKKKKQEAQNTEEVTAFKDGKTGQDLVMDVTGMFLLEDPGLQSFVPEAFQPFTWAARASEKGEQVARSAARKSSIHVPASGQTTPQDLIQTRDTSSTPASISNPQPLDQTQVHYLRQHSSLTENSYQQAQPEQQHARNVSNEAWAARLNLGTFERHKLQQHHPTSLDLSQFPSAATRHHSYPSMHSSVPVPPEIRAAYTLMGNSKIEGSPLQHPLDTPQQTSLNAFLEGVPQPTNQVTNASVHPSWAARPVPMTNHSPNQDPASNHRHFSGFSQNISQPYHTTTAYPGQISDAARRTSSHNAIPATFGDWARLVGSSGT